jgi:hypothetical protein
VFFIHEIHFLPGSKFHEHKIIHFFGFISLHSNMVFTIGPFQLYSNLAHHVIFSYFLINYTIYSCIGRIVDAMFRCNGYDVTNFFNVYYVITMIHCIQLLKFSFIYANFNYVVWFHPCNLFQQYYQLPLCGQFVHDLGGILVKTKK